MSASDRGALSLLLHTHMPYVEGFGTWPFGEEWLWEAVISAYLPLIEVLEGAPVTIGLTPVLCDQLETLSSGAPGGARARLERFAGEVRREVHRLDGDGLRESGAGELAEEVGRAWGDYERALAQLDAAGGDVLARFAALGAGAAELWTSAATHAVLPLLATDACRALQVHTGVLAHERRFGHFDGGFWLPECAYEPGLERDLAEHGVRAFCVDQTDAFGLGSSEQLEPVRTAAGPVAVPIDWATVGLVWDDRSGYPTHPAYRDYHARTYHDLRPWANDGSPYDRDRALGVAREHARDFVARSVERLDRHAAERGRAGLLCVALDTELLGHWWYEGPAWLAAVLEDARGQGLELAPVGAALERIEPVERELAASTWGTPKDMTTWDSPRVAEIAFAARRGEMRTVVAAAGARGDAPAQRAALERAARELMALQASDWAFQVTRDLAGDYPLERLRGHAERLDAALAALEDSSGVPEPALRNLAPDLDLAPLLAA